MPTVRALRLLMVELEIDAGRAEEAIAFLHNVAVPVIRFGWELDEPQQVEYDGRASWMMIRNSIFRVVVKGREPTGLPTFLNEVMTMLRGLLDALG